MKIVAVISEYNPFHNGHEYQLEKIRENGASHVVVIMSPNFVQRGDIAVFDKKVRAKAALSSGADLVIELPVAYALSSAKQFAFGAVSLVNAIGCIDELNFGSECGDIKKLEQIAKFVYSNDIYEKLSKHLKMGMTFPSARSLAVLENLGSEAKDIISEPNNTLAIEYIGQLLKTKSIVSPTTIKRTVSHHASEKEQSFASASYIRKLIYDDKLDDIEKLVPQNTFKIYSQAMANGFAPNEISSLFPQLLYKLRCMEKEDFRELFDVNEGLENRIYSAVRKSSTIPQILDEIKTKRYTHSRIRRILVSSLLAIKSDMCLSIPPYLRVLGFNEKGREVLSLMKKTATLPVSDSLARLEKLGGECARYTKLQSLSQDIYTLSMKNTKPCGEDYRENAVVIKANK